MPVIDQSCNSRGYAAFRYEFDLGQSCGAQTLAQEISEQVRTGISMSGQTKLYAAQEPVFPRRVTGRFRRFKWVIMAVTLGIYYLSPRSQRIHGLR